MSRTIESSGAALAALCLAGVSSQANAATVTIPVSILHDSNVYTNIAIDSATPQFFYNSYIYNKYPFYGQEADFGTQNSGQIAASGNAGTNSVDSALTYGNSTTEVSYKNLLTGTGYVQISFFDELSNQTEYGYASFNQFGDLVSITGDISSVTLNAVANTTPLPASWALFTGGAALMGAVAQRRRRRRKQAA
jgi:hypothetical protein